MTTRDREAASAVRRNGAAEAAEYLTATIGDQLFGIPVLQIQDVLGPQRITRIPLAPPEVAGSLNLRGRIVTAIDLRLRFGLGPNPEPGHEMSVVVDCDGELYSLIVDRVGEVIKLATGDIERSPGNLDPAWREMSMGVYRLNDRLMVELDVPRLLDFGPQAAA